MSSVIYICMITIVFVSKHISMLSNITSYNVLVVMVDKSPTNRFDLVHIGPAIDIAQKVNPFLPLPLQHFIFLSD